MTPMVEPYIPPKPAVARVVPLWVPTDKHLMFTWAGGGSTPERSLPLVLIHGLGMSSHYLLSSAKRLAQDQFVLVPDLPGSGRSSKPGGVLDISALADALVSWIQSLELERAVFVGHSLGCQVGVDLAARYPDLVDRLVLIAPTMPPEASNPFWLIWHLLVDLFREPLVYWPLFMEDYLRTGPWRAFETFRHALADPMAAKLRHVSAPTLVIRAERDPLVPQAWAEFVTRQLPDGHLKVLPGGSHAIHLTRPEALVQTVNAFLLDTAHLTHCAAAGRPS